MAQEGGYATSGQFKAIADSATGAALAVAKMAQDLAAFSAITATISQSAQAFAQLQQTLTLTNAVAQGTAAELKAMEGQVRNFALAAKFSASESASALYFLASAGFSTQQSMTALNGVMLLAQASLSDLSTTSDTIANALSTFNLQASDSIRVANLFSASMNFTQASMDKIAYSMRQVAPIAKSMNLSIEETTTALSVLYNAGLRGEPAGSTLREIFVKLANPVREAAQMMADLGIQTQKTDGTMRNAIDVLRDLQRLNLGPASLNTLFPDRNLASAQVVLASLDEGAFQRRMQQDKQYADQVANVARQANVSVESIKNGFELVQTAISNTNAASRTAMAQITTLASSFSLARNAVTEFGIELGNQLSPGLNSISAAIVNMTIGFRGLTENQRALIVDLPLLAVGIYGAQKALVAMTTAAVAMSRAEDFGGFRAMSRNVRDATAALTGFGVVQNRISTITGNAVVRSPNGRNWQDTGTGMIIRQSATTVASETLPSGGALNARSIAGTVAGVLGMVTTVAMIAAIAAQVIPVIVDYVKNYNAPNKLVGDLNLQSAANQQSQSILIGGARPTQKVSQLQDLITTTQQTGETLQGLLKRQQEELSQAQSALSEALQQPGAQIIVPDMEGRVEFVESEDVMKARKRVDDAKYQINDLSEKIKTVKPVVDSLKKTIQFVQQGTDFKNDKLVADEAKKWEDANTPGTFTYFSQVLVKQYEKDIRDAQMQLRTAAAAIKADPIEQEIIANQNAQLNEVKQLLEAATRHENEITKDFGKNLAQTLDFGKVLSGQDYLPMGETERRQNWISVLEQGGSQQAALEALQQAIDYLMTKSGVTDPQVMIRIQQYAKFQAEMIANAVGTVNAQQMRNLITRMEAQRTNAAFVQQLRDVFRQNQVDFLSAIAQASNDPSTRAAIDLASLAKRSEDFEVQLTEYMTKWFAQRGDPTHINAALQAEWRTVEAQLREAAQRANNQALKNIMSIKDNAQADFIAQLRQATAASRTGQTSVAAEIAAYFRSIMGGDGGLGGLANEGITAETYERNLSQIQDAQKKLRDLRTQMQGLRDARSGLATGTQELPLQAPANIVGDQSALDQKVKVLNDLEKQAVATTKQIQYLKGVIDSNPNGSASGAREEWEAQNRSLVILRAKIEAQRESVANEQKEAETVKSTAVAAQAKKDAQQSAVDPKAQSALLTAMQREEEQLVRQIELLRQRNELTTSGIQRAADEANSRYRNEEMALNKTKELYERNGSVIDGLRFAQMKLSHEAQTDFQIAANAYSAFAQSAATNLTDLITGQQKDWKVALANIARDIAQTILKALILKSIAGVGNMVGLGNLGAVASYNGNVFMGGQVVPFDRGGVVHAPTNFTMPDGRKASMSEYFAEAIMPLARGPNGKLGVAVYGGGTPDMQVNVPQAPIVPANNNINFNPSITNQVVLGGGQGGGGSPTQSRDQMRMATRMQQDLDREVNATVQRVIRGYQRPGGGMNPADQRLGLNK